MIETKISEFGSPKGTAKLAEWVQEEMDLETVNCATNEGHQRPGRRLTNLSVTLPDRPVEDIVWTWQSECLLTDHALGVFKSSGLTGFEVKRAKARYKRSNKAAPRLWELSVIGWGGMAPPDCGIKLIQRCDTCGHLVYSRWTNAMRLFDTAQWDGSDFFLIWPLPGFIFVTSRVASLIQTARLSGAVITPIEQLVPSPHTIEKLSPGRLSYYMPEERARLIGSPLGIY
jgi:hypothetical protein